MIKNMRGYNNTIPIYQIYDRITFSLQKKKHKLPLTFGLFLNGAEYLVKTLINKTKKILKPKPYSEGFVK